MKIKFTTRNNVSNREKEKKSNCFDENISQPSNDVCCRFLVLASFFIVSNTFKKKVASGITFVNSTNACFSKQSNQKILQKIKRYILIEPIIDFDIMNSNQCFE